MESTDNRAGFQQAPFKLLWRAEIRAEWAPVRKCAAGRAGVSGVGLPGWTCPKPDQVIQADLDSFPWMLPQMKFLQQSYFMPVLHLQATAVLWKGCWTRNWTRNSVFYRQNVSSAECLCKAKQLSLWFFWALWWKLLFIKRSFAPECSPVLNVCMHEAGDAHPSFTHPHTDEWQEIENAAHGVCTAQFVLWNPQVRFCVWVCNVENFLSFTKIKFNFLERQGQGFFFGGRRGKWDMETASLTIKKLFINYLKTCFLPSPPQNTPSCEPHALCRGVAQSQRHLFRFQLQITNKNPFSCSPGTCVCFINPAGDFQPVRAHKRGRAGVITFVKCWQSCCYLLADGPLTGINIFLLLARGG